MLSFGKKKSIALLIAGTVLLSGCGWNGNGDSVTGSGSRGTEAGAEASGGANAAGEGAGGKAMGRFVEQEIELPGEIYLPEGLVQKGEKIRYVDAAGQDYISQDAGESYHPADKVNEELAERLEQEDYMSGLAADPEGNRLAVFADFEGEDLRYFPKLYKADGGSIEVTGWEDAEYMDAYYGSDGSFYLATQKEIYRVDDNGRAESLFRVQGTVGYLSVCGKYLMLGADDFYIYDLEKREEAEQDKVLYDFLKKWQNSYTYTGEYPFLIYPAEGESIYVVTWDGLYRHTMYGSTMEQIIDGSLCSIGDVSKMFLGMAVTEGEAGDIFSILYSDGALMRYTYDADTPTVPDMTLRIYSLYDNEEVKQAVSAFQQRQRDVYVKYEAGIDSDSSLTREDALKNLSTELAAGNGPDVLVMDGIPIDSYAEKGVLADISSLIERMEGESFFDNVLEQYRREGKMYAAPMAFTFPVLTGKAEAIGDAYSLEELADCMEQAREQQPQGSLINIADAYSALNLLAQSSSGAWIREDGSLDCAALTEFLTQSRRIYEAQMSGIGESEIEELSVSQSRTNGRKIGVDAAENAIYFVYGLKQPFSAGMMESGVDSFSFYQAELNTWGQDYKLLPGQCAGSFQPKGVLAVNAASAVREQAEDFLIYALSEEFQSSAFLNGIPVNKGAFAQKQAYPYEGQDMTAVYGMVSVMDSKGEECTIEVRWADKEEFDYLEGLAESLTQVSRCDDEVLETVAELGQAALTGEKSVEETVNEIEKKVQLYLAE